MSHVIPGDLPTVWRERADTLREFGDPNSARLWDIAARELESALAVFAVETLSLVEAARDSGYTPDHLGKLVKDGKIVNAGRSGAPRIRRCDLPQKGLGGRGRPTRAKAVVTDIDVRRVAHLLKERR